MIQISATNTRDRRVFDIRFNLPIHFGLIISAGLFTSASLAAKAWDARVLEETPVPEIGGTVFKIEFESGATKDRFRAHVVRFRPEDCVLKIIDQPNREQGRPNVAEVAERHGAVAAVNAGFFKADFGPAGLYVLDGKEISPLAKGGSLSGVLRVDDDGALCLTPRGEWPKPARYAVQAGPFLIDPGGKMGIRSRGAAFARRTAVALMETGMALLINTSSTTLYDLAECLLDHADLFGAGDIERALNLDGGPSTALFVKLPDSPIVVKEKGAVRNHFVLLPRASVNSEECE